MINFKNVTKKFQGGVIAVDNLTLDVEEGETLVLLGTSGSGKTTTMKMVNRLIEPTGGSIKIGGKDVMNQNVIELRRSIGYAIQHIGLFPHMTIAQNIAVVPKLLNWPNNKITTRINELLTLVGLTEDFALRFPNQLSGGQKQRIGVARALAADPPIILMDEPFGALDPITREQLQDEFLELESEIRKTIIFVTHDVVEAVKMGNRIALMDQGKIKQIAQPNDLIENPANEFVEDFLGQHRFQLSLMTRNISEITTKNQSDLTHTTELDHLHINSNYLQALDIFKRTKNENLPVFKGKLCIGTLKRSQLFNAMSDIVL
jgi:osmoprotectant transport system ATP-binding protein